jgi:hypothetical protein
MLAPCAHALNTPAPRSQRLFLHVSLGVHGRLLPVFGFLLQHARTAPSRAQGPAIQMCTPSRWVEGTLETRLHEARLANGAVLRFESREDYEDQRRRIESFEMSPWSPTDMEKACYEKQASHFNVHMQYYYPHNEPVLDLKAFLERCRSRARRLAAGRVPDGVSEEGLEAARSQCVKRDQLLQEKADRDRKWEEYLRGVAEWSARGDLLHPGTSEAKAHGMLKDAHSELLGSLSGSHPLDTPEEASARFRKSKKRYDAVRAIVKNLGFGDRIL